MQMKETWGIQIKGLVQGVGFRPFVHRIAHDLDLTGRVCNSPEGVFVEINANSSLAGEFLAAVRKDPPLQSRITDIYLERITHRDYPDFRIIPSFNGQPPDLLFTPDYAMCKQCETELLNPADSRAAYPFISCTDCGPRYSIVSALPYDRARTSMEVFTPCPMCKSEFDDPGNRRHHAQNISCPECGVRLELFDNSDQQLPFKQPQKIVSEICSLLKDGRIIALKGMSGYLLCCDAKSRKAISLLRERKNRPSKPFALLYPSLGKVEQDFVLDPNTRTLLDSPVRPIVLLPFRHSAKTLALDCIAPGLDKLGVMLPYTPLLKMLMLEYSEPLVATSGNIHNSPIVSDVEEITAGFNSISDYRLDHNLKIIHAQDDSVFSIAPWSGRQIILRRARGLAPNYNSKGIIFPHRTILGTGADLKSAFALLNRGKVTISPFLGDLSYLETSERYLKYLESSLSMLECSPQIILADKHPAYQSVGIAASLAEEYGAQLFQIQHHKAHFAAIIAEHQLHLLNQPILGVIWDGTGYGDDANTLWGGEFFLHAEGSCERIAHFSEFPSILGDKMAREPRISALACTYQLPGANRYLESKFSPSEFRIYSAKLHNHNKKGLASCSVGRLFDAVASILGLGDKQSFEGEIAMKLEALARSYLSDRELEFAEAYVTEIPYLISIPVDDLLAAVIRDIKLGKSPGFIAANFHYSLAMTIGRIAKLSGVEHIAFSGGVFQNSLLVDIISKLYEGKYKLYFHEQLSPNDENIALGQLMYYKLYLSEHEISI